ncbi:MAG TPA: TetR/AcrR family transcriptional regulator [Solirubrobacteraceae bacterium]|nr:TetR/AcrR family transcriptional regulator [Solirubrobacteraceae bacterium]
MARRGSTSLSTRGGDSSKSKGSQQAKGSARVSSTRIAPLYKRLPHGPHRLERDEVVLHQRTRIHGAMVEAVAAHGYEGTSVKQVIGLAGVSRRSFYEQFANKQACFLATFDVIARRELKQIRKAYLAHGGPLEDRTRAAFERFARMTAEDRNATILVVLEAQRAGQAGVLRLRRVTGACEQMITQSFADSSGAVALPLPIVRGITGGLHRTAATFLREQRKPSSVNLAEEMLRWTMLFQTPAAEHLAERMAPGLSARMREISSAQGHGPINAQARRDERTRALDGVLRLVTREDYPTLSAPQIADEANLSIDSFCEMFASKDDCYLEALDMIGDELLSIAADPELVSSDWPRAVRRVMAELTRYLGEHPLYARTLVQEAFFTGEKALERTVELSHSIATLLTEGAPAASSPAGEAQGGLTTDAVAGAIWHTIRCQVVAGRIQLLGALADHLTYVVLAPYLGAEEAIEIVTEERCPAMEPSQ